MSEQKPRRPFHRILARSRLAFATAAVAVVGVSFTPADATRRDAWRLARRIDAIPGASGVTFFRQEGDPTLLSKLRSLVRGA